MAGKKKEQSEAEIGVARTLEGLYAAAEQMRKFAAALNANTALQKAVWDAAGTRARAGDRAALAVAFEEFRPDGRPTFDALYLAVAQVVGTAADCSRPGGRVGAVAVRDDVPLAWGYVGVAAGAPGCLSGACPRATSEVPPGSDYDNCISQHAEINLFGFAAHHGISLADATLYVSREPCKGCYKAISAARIVRVVFPGRLTTQPPA